MYNEFGSTASFFGIAFVLSIPGLILLTYYRSVKITDMKKAGCTWSKKQKVTHLFLELFSTFVPAPIVILMFICMINNSSVSEQALGFLIAILFPVVVIIACIVTFIISLLCFKAIGHLRVQTGGDNNYYEELEKFQKS